MTAQGVHFQSKDNFFICSLCGIELSAYEILRLKNEAIRSENTILQKRLFETGTHCQNYEIRIRTYDIQIAKLEKSFDNLQVVYANQQEALETEKREHALASQSLTHEVKRHAANEALIEHQHHRNQDLIRLLNTIDIPRRTDPNDNTGIGTVWLEKESLKVELQQQNAKTQNLEVELQNVRGNLRHKQHLLEDLSDSLNVKAESVSMPPNSESSEGEVEVKTAVLLPVKTKKQQKRMRN